MIGVFLVGEQQNDGSLWGGWEQISLWTDAAWSPAWEGRPGAPQSAGRGKIIVGCTFSQPTISELTEAHWSLSRHILHSVGLYLMRMQVSHTQFGYKMHVFSCCSCHIFSHRWIYPIYSSRGSNLLNWFWTLIQPRRGKRVHFLNQCSKSLF